MWSSDGESIFKDDIESLNTDDVLTVILGKCYSEGREGECYEAFQSKI